MVYRRGLRSWDAIGAEAPPEGPAASTAAVAEPARPHDGRFDPRAVSLAAAVAFGLLLSGTSWPLLGAVAALAGAGRAAWRAADRSVVPTGLAFCAALAGGAFLFGLGGRPRPRHRGPARRPGGAAACWWPPGCGRPRGPGGCGRWAGGRWASSAACPRCPRRRRRSRGSPRRAAWPARPDRSRHRCATPHARAAAGGRRARLGGAEASAKSQPPPARPQRRLRIRALDVLLLVLAAAPALRARRLGRLARGDQQVVEERRRQPRLQQRAVERLQQQVAAVGVAAATRRGCPRARRWPRASRLAQPNSDAASSSPRHAHPLEARRRRRCAGSVARGERVHVHHLLELCPPRWRPPLPSSYRRSPAPISARHSGATRVRAALRHRREAVAVARGLAAEGHHAARAQHAPELAERGVEVGQVVEHGVAEHEVEGLVLERQRARPRRRAVSTSSAEARRPTPTARRACPGEMSVATASPITPARIRLSEK